MLRTLFLSPVLLISSSAFACGMMLNPTMTLASLEVVIEEVDQPKPVQVVEPVEAKPVQAEQPVVIPEVEQAAGPQS